MEKNNLNELTEKELLEVSAGGKCTLRKATAEAAGGAIIGSLGGPWGAASGAVIGVGNCLLDDVIF